MSKYKIGDVFVPNGNVISSRAFDRAEVVAFTPKGAAFTPEGSAILRITKPSGGRFLVDDLVERSDHTLDAYYTLAKPKPAFFEVDKFYRFDGMAPYSTGYIRYEIKEIFETPQNDGRVFLQAHAEAVGPLTIAQTFLSEGDFRAMIKM